MFADVAEEYTAVQEEQRRLMLYAFCRWLDVVHGSTYLGAWTAEAVKKLDKNGQECGEGLIEELPLLDVIIHADLLLHALGHHRFKP